MGQRLFHSLCANIIIPQLQIYWLSKAVLYRDVNVGVEVAVFQVFLVMVKQMLSYWYSNVSAIASAPNSVVLLARVG